MIQSKRLQSQASSSPATPSSHVNYRYLSAPQLATRLQHTHHQFRVASKQISRLQDKISKSTEEKGVVVDEDVHAGLCNIMRTEASEIYQKYKPDSFHHIFWKQQMDASSRQDAKGMRWHPSMIRWCLFLRHKSSGAYEALRESGVLKLPSQRTLRDYTHYVKAATGFSAEVDKMLVQAAKVATCPEREKCVLLLLDEMHIREDLVYDKHTGELIGFTNLGDTTNHLLAFEQSLANSSSLRQPLARTMMVFMVRGLFSKLQFAYAQFPCASVTGDLLYAPFWEAVGRIEACGLKVRSVYKMFCNVYNDGIEVLFIRILGATLDGNSVNRRLIKIHDTSNKLLYKTSNPFADDSRPLLFFSDPPHLIKTARNCWSSKHRNLWVSMIIIIHSSWWLLISCMIELFLY